MTKKSLDMDTFVDVFVWKTRRIAVGLQGLF